jgi:hypothetical protein
MQGATDMPDLFANLRSIGRNLVDFSCVRLGGSAPSQNRISQDNPSTPFGVSRFIGSLCIQWKVEANDMLWTIFVILLVLWLLGFVSSYTLGGFIHILLVLAVVVLILQLISGRRSAL